MGPSEVAVRRVIREPQAPDRLCHPSVLAPNLAPYAKPQAESATEAQLESDRSDTPIGRDPKRPIS